MLIHKSEKKILPTGSPMTEMVDAWPTGGAPPVPAAAPFTFQKPHGKLDWREMSKIDLERVNREVRAAGCSN